MFYLQTLPTNVPATQKRWPKPHVASPLTLPLGGAAKNIDSARFSWHKAGPNDGLVVPNANEGRTRNRTLDAEAHQAFWLLPNAA